MVAVITILAFLTVSHCWTLGWFGHRLPESFTPIQIPSVVPVPTNFFHCQFPFEVIDRKCQLQCPTERFMTMNPTVKCRPVITKSFREPTEDRCLNDEQLTLGMCVKPIDQCPPGYDFEGGLCVKPCPPGTVPVEMMAEFRKDGFIEQRLTQVCQARPISRL